MRRTWLLGMVLTSCLTQVGARGNPPGTDGNAARKSQTITLSTRDQGKSVLINVGDTLIIGLPMRMPSWWVKIDETPALQAVGKPEFREVPRQDEPEHPPLGRGFECVLTYKVIATPERPVPASWEYSRFGKPSRPPQDAKPPLIRPDMTIDDLKTGMVFRVTLTGQAR